MMQKRNLIWTLMTLVPLELISLSELQAIEIHLECPAVSTLQFDWTVHPYKCTGVPAPTSDPSETKLTGTLNDRLRDIHYASALDTHEDIMACTYYGDANPLQPHHDIKLFNIEGHVVVPGHTVTNCRHNPENTLAIICDKD